MKRKIFYTIGAAILTLATLAAQETTVENIKIEQVRIEKQGDNLKAGLRLNLDDLRMGAADMIVLTPVIRSADKAHAKTFAPVVLTGSRRSRTLQRAIDFDGYRFEREPQQIVRRKNKQAQSVDISLSTPYQDWMRSGELVVVEATSGCDICEKVENEYTVYHPLLPQPADPVYTIAYVTPPVEEVKQRSETHTARLNFEVGKSVILENFKDNKEVLADVGRIIGELRSDRNLTINEFTVTGYASPDGNEQSNMKLSESRAKAFVTYLTEQHGISPSSIRANWMGEDWSGLYGAVEASSIEYRDEVLQALDAVTVAQRKARLQRAGGGKAYRILLDEIYPPLRRNEYTISFVAKKFSVDEAKEQIRTKPQYLSLNEMFLVANTYPKTSAEFKEVFGIAARLYPDSPVAQQNVAANELENGQYDDAIRRLQTIDLPEAWNNLGVAYAHKGEHQRALECFENAVKGGYTSAATNAAQLSEWLSAQ